MESPLSSRRAPLLVVFALALGCVGEPATPDDGAPADTDPVDAPQDTDPVPSDSDSDAPADSDSDAVVAAPFQPRWFELTAAYVAQHSTRTQYDPAADPPPRETDLSQGMNTITVGTHVMGPADATVTVMLDLLRDLDHDGEIDARGFFLQYDPAANGGQGALVDHPDLPETFGDAGLQRYGGPPMESVWLAGIVDLDGDGQSEVVWGGGGATLLFRWDAEAGEFAPLVSFSEGLPADIRSQPPPQSLGVSDVDNDGLLDLTFFVPQVLQGGTVSPHGPIATLFRQYDGAEPPAGGSGAWAYRDLHDPGGHPWVTAVSGIASVWESPGGRQLQITANDDIGSCWMERRTTGPGAGTALTTDGYPRFDPCPYAEVIGSFGSNDTPMGIHPSADLAHLGVGYALLTPGTPQLTVTDMTAAFATPPVFTDQSRVLDLLFEDRCALGEVPVPDADGVGWTCPRHPTATTPNEAYLPWGVACPDINKDGWCDPLIVAGDDQDSFNLCRRRGERCYQHAPVTLWMNNGDPNPRAWNLPTFDNVRAEDWDSNAPVIGDWMGLITTNLDGDADLDYAFSATGSGKPTLWRDDTPTGHLGFCLRGRGVLSNPLGVGSRVVVTTPGGMRQVFDVNISSQADVVGPPLLCVGLGTEPTATVEWTWPSGIVQTVTSVPGVADGEPGEYVIEEPAEVQLLRYRSPTAERSTRRLDAQYDTLTLRLCAYSRDPVPFGDAPRVATGAPPAWTVTRDDMASGTFSRASVDTNASTPAGCVDYAIQTNHPGFTRLTVARDGTAYRTRPRVWWE